MVSMLDPWRTLGLEPGASAAEVKRAYRRLAKTFHPDSAGPAALPRFLAIQQAYEALISPRAPRVIGRARTATTSPDAARGPGWKADPRRTRSTPGASGPGASGPRTGPRPAGEPGERPKRPRRPSRRATFGSTTYGEAHEPGPGEWAGASWYGTSSGEYWRVNPREYADPRKHGPEYQARARRAGGGEVPDDGPATGAGQADSARAPRRSTASSPPPFRPAASVASPGDPETTGFPSLPSVRLPDGSTGRSRLALVLLAWPPLGLLAASLVGSLTGCARYAAACAPGTELLPWLAQVAILAGLAVLVMRPGIVRALAGGTLVTVALAVPATLFLAATGATYDPLRGPLALSVVLALGWFAGVVLVGSGRSRGRAR